MTNRSYSTELREHLTRVDGHLDAVEHAVQDGGLIAAPALANGAATLLRERRETLAQIRIADDNARIKGGNQ